MDKLLLKRLEDIIPISTIVLMQKSDGMTQGLVNDYRKYYFDKGLKLKSPREFIREVVAELRSVL